MKTRILMMAGMFLLLSGLASCGEIPQPELESDKTFVSLVSRGALVDVTKEMKEPHLQKKYEKINQEFPYIPAVTVEEVGLLLKKFKKGWKECEMNGISDDYVEFDRESFVWSTGFSFGGGERLWFHFDVVKHIPSAGNHYFMTEGGEWLSESKLFFIIPCGNRTQYQIWDLDHFVKEAQAMLFFKVMDGEGGERCYRAIFNITGRMNPDDKTAEFYYTLKDDNYKSYSFYKF